MLSKAASPVRKKAASPLDVQLADVRKAHLELQKYLKPSPLLLNSWLSESLGCEVYLKLENMQPIGSFKIRGALNRILMLSKADRKKGVIAASAGNHAQGVAWAAKQLGVSATIVMPKLAPLVKVQNTKALGAQVVLSGENYDQAYTEAKGLAKKSGRVFIHAFEDPAIVAGQGTIALELLSQQPDLDWVIGSVGGGGMMSGVGLVYKSLSPQTRIVGCQAAMAPSMIRSIASEHALSISSSDTFADGIAVVKTSEPMRQLIAPVVDEWVECSEDAIALAVLTLMEKAKTIAEGSGATPLAALESLAPRVQGKKVAIIVSGGNIDVNLLSRIIDLGLIRAGRRLRITVRISDKPGSLARLTTLIASEGANILQAIHDRDEPSTKLNETEVALTLETKGPEHSAELIELLRKNVLRLELAH